MAFKTRKLGRVVGFLSLLFITASITYSQTNATAQIRPALKILDSTKEQDGLIGSVRRVKTEIARIDIKEGLEVEGPRQLLEVTTYGVRGNRIDNISYPIPNSDVGREEYKYDDRGNIVEKVLRDEKGTVLSREAYEYVFDEVGNWTKMTASLVVVENGELKRERVEVTYRTFTYYANENSQQIATGAASENSATPGAASPSVDRVEKTANATPPKSSGESLPETTENSTSGGNNNSESAEKKVGTQEPNSPTTPVQRLPVETSSTGVNGVMPPATVEKLQARAEKSLEKSLFESRAQPNPYTKISETQNNPESASIGDAPSKWEARKKNDPQVEESAALNSEPATSRLRTVNADPKPNANLTARSEPIANSERPPAPPSGATVSQPVSSKTNPEAATTVAAQPAVKLNVPENTAAEADAARSSTSVKAYDVYKLGREKFEAGDVKAAIDAYLESVRLEPTSAEYRLNLGHAYLSLKKDKEAIKAFKEAVDLNPDLAEAHYGLGFVCFRSAKFKEAMEAFKKATTLVPEMAKAHYGLALTYIELRRMDEVIQEHRILQRLDPRLATKLTQAFPDVDFSCRGSRFCK